IDYSDEKTLMKSVFEKISNHIEVGTELLLGQIFNEIGFNKLNDEIFRDLVFARLSYPASKLKTSGYIRRYKSREVPAHQIYRYLDKLYSRQKEQVQQISYEHTRKILGNEISVVFYD